MLLALRGRAEFGLQPGLWSLRGRAGFGLRPELVPLRDRARSRPGMPSHFHLLAQMKVTKAKCLNTIWP